MSSRFDLPSYPSHFIDTARHAPYDPRGAPPPFTTVAVRTAPVDRTQPRPTPWPPLTIGKTPIYSPLVSLAEARDHLRLLAAFRRQRLAVSRAHALGGPTDNLSPAERCKVFLHHATWRFQCWIQYFARVGVKDDDALDELPLDCVQAWHTLALSPRWYREDCKRLHPGLTWKADDDEFVPKSFPLRDIVSRSPRSQPRSSSDPLCTGGATGLGWEPPRGTTGNLDESDGYTFRSDPGPISPQGPGDCLPALLQV